MLVVAAKMGRVTSIHIELGLAGPGLRRGLVQADADPGGGMVWAKAAWARAAAVRDDGPIAIAEQDRAIGPAAGAFFVALPLCKPARIAWTLLRGAGYS